jgi:hypothetical protein
MPLRAMVGAVRMVDWPVVGVTRFDASCSQVGDLKWGWLERRTKGCGFAPGHRLVSGLDPSPVHGEAGAVTVYGRQLQAQKGGLGRLDGAQVGSSELQKCSPRSRLRPLCRS